MSAVADATAAESPSACALEAGPCIGEARFAVGLHARGERTGAALEALAEVGEFGVTAAEQFDGRGFAALDLFAGPALGVRFGLEARDALGDIRRVAGDRLQIGDIGRPASVRLGRIVDLDHRKRITIGVVEVDAHAFRQITGRQVDGVGPVDRLRAEAFAGCFSHQRPPTCAPSGMVAVISSSASMRNSMPSILKRLPA